MAIDTSFTQGTPYWDDYSQRGNSSKNYLRILFQPGRSVQVRELNQMQSAIQDQIDKFGQHIFNDGSRVLDGQINIDNKVQFLDLTLEGTAQSAAQDTARPLIGAKIYARASGSGYSGADVSATIMDYELKSGAEYRFYVRYTSQATDFAGGGRIQTSIKIGQSITGTGYSISINDVLGDGSGALTTGYACKIHNSKGVYFVKGYFVEAPEQIKYVNTTSGNSSGPYASINGKIGFTVTEQKITAINDSFLYDNADGQPNFSAPGADRYSISLGLVLITSDTNLTSESNVVNPSADPAPTNLVDTVGIIDSVISEPVETRYSQLGDTLAQRTSEESGDYALQPFQLDLREDFDNGFNRGRSTGGDATKFVATLEPSVAYVKGRRIEIRAKQSITVPKARETHAHSNELIQALMGSYIEVDNIDYLPKINTSESYQIGDGTIDPADVAGTKGNNVATAKIVGLEYTGKKYRIYLNEVTMDNTTVGGRTLSLADGRNIYGGTTSDSQGAARFIGIINADSQGTILRNVGEESKLFRLPADVVKSLEESGETRQVKIPVRDTEVVSGFSSNTIQFTLSSGSFYHDNPNEYIVINSANGDVISVTDVALSGSGLTTVTLTVGTASGNAHVQYSKRITATKGTKTKTSGTKTISAAAVYNIGDEIDLGQVDVIQIDTLSSAASGGGTDLSSHFQLDNGQTSIAYNNSKLICVKATTSTEIHCDFQHLAHSAGDFFSVDSYPIADTLSSTEIERIQIPFQHLSSLTDYLDFRASGHQTLDPNGVIEIDYIETYLPRHDRIVLNSSGNFVYLEGDAQAAAPKPVPEDAMQLYDLDVPAYTNSVSDIEIGYIDNRRYTMRDIGKIERRVKNLEYYTSLSLLEKATRDKQIFDNTGDRFKNGIIVDEFKGHQVGLPGDSGYLVAMDPERGEARPSFTTNAVGIRNNDMDNSSGTGADVAGPAGTSHIGSEDLLRLPITSVNTLIEQPFASVSISVNPFDVASWVGEIKLSPSTDEWRDTTRRPEVIIKQDGNADAILQIMNETLASTGTRWNDWNTTWSGVTDVKSLGWQTMGGAREILGDHATHTRNCKCGHKNTIVVPNFNGGTTTVRNERRARILLEARTIETNQIRTGIQQFAETQTLTESLGDKVVDVSFVPFIRSRKVYFTANGFKPNTILYPFFDDTDISGYTFGDATYLPAGVVREYREDTTHEDFTNKTAAQVTSGTITTDESGRASGYFVIPNTESQRFRTGEREFRLVDNSTNDLSTSTSYGTTTYTARGMLQTVQEQILSTRQVVISEREVTDERTLTRTQLGENGVRHVDPLAQTFVVDVDQHPQGVYLKDIDLFFHKKHDTLPVRIQIVTAENGIPTQKIVPFSQVSKEASEITATVGSTQDANSENSTRATTFTFESLVHLRGGVEYAIVVLSNSPDYFLWHSEVGGDDKATGKRITKNPYTGVALKSANASTWTPDQNKDFKFTMRYAKFFESGTSVTKTIGNSSSNTAFGDFVSILPAEVYGAALSSSNKLKVDAVNLIAETVVPPDTQIAYFLKTRATSGGAITTRRIEPNSTVEFGTTLHVDSTDQIELYIQLLSSNSKLTPLLDVTRLSLLTFANTVNAPTKLNLENATDTGVSPNIKGELAPTHGSANARYITKMITLANSASRLDCYVDVSRPSPTCNVHAYAKFTDSGNYIKLEAADIPITPGFTEVHFRTPDSAASTELNFEKFQIKIVFTVSDATNTATICRLMNFRAVATS
tara:strand:+ start:157 stop:5400 length:5244 start_codon:yes stop_codon:yes gene_type:complete